VTMRRRGENNAAALDHCRRAVFYNERLAALHPEDLTASYDLVFHLLWRAQAEHAAGQAGPARRTRTRYLDLTKSLVAHHHNNMLLREQQMELYVSHAEFLRAQGELRAAQRYLAEARAISQGLAARDPQNAVWAGYERRLAEPRARSR
jgi:hypothetical protein